MINNQGIITNSSSTTTSTNHLAKEVRGFTKYPGDLSVSNANIPQQKQLLPNEGKVGTYGELKSLENRSTNTAAHHMPHDHYMKTKKWPVYENHPDPARVGCECGNKMT